MTITPKSKFKFSVLKSMYREVQLDFTPEIEVFYMLFRRSHIKNGKRSLKQQKMLEFPE